jgi:hypothetical protein
MPIVYGFRDGVLVVAAVGDHNRPELRAALEASLADSRFGSGAPLLLDWRSSLASGVFLGDLQERAKALVTLCAGRVPRVAIVAREEGLGVRIQEAAVTALRAEGMPARAFTDPEEAVAWLRLADAQS